MIAHVRSDDSRIVGLVGAGAGLADEVGPEDIGWPELRGALDDSSLILAAKPAHPSRDDYALAAGSDAWPHRGRGADRPGRRVDQLERRSPGIFDAAENTVEWSVEVAGTAATAVVCVAVIGPDPATGIAVQLRSQAVSSTGALDADGRATLPLVGTQQRPMTEQAAWDHDWPATSVIIGTEIPDVTESRATRDRVRRLARLRMEQRAKTRSWPRSWLSNPPIKAGDDSLC